MANWPWRVSVRLIAFAKKSILVLGIILFVLLAVRVYLSQQGPELHRWHTWRADEMSVQEMDKANFAQYLTRENAIFSALENEVTAKTEAEEQTPLTATTARAWYGQDSFHPMPTVHLC